MEAQPFELSFLSPGASVRSRGRALPSQAGPGKAPRPARPAAPFPRSLPRLRDVHGTSSVFHRDNRSYRALGASPGPALTLSAARSSPGAAGRSRGQERGRSRGRQRRRGRPSPSTARRRGRGWPGAISLSAARVGCDEGGRGSAEGFATLMSPSSSPHILILILSPMLFLPYPF